MVTRRPALTSTPPSPLLRALALALGLAVVVVTLYPFGPWSPRSEPTLAYLARGLPRYWTGFDVVSNVVAYLLLGALASVAFMRKRSPLGGMLQITLACVLLSLTLETAQTGLPQRVPSLLDLLANSLGGLLGAGLGALVHQGRQRSPGRRLPVARRWYDEGPPSGWLLLIAWLAVQAVPQAMLFSGGDLRAAVQTLLDALGPSPWPLDAATALTDAQAPRFEVWLDRLWAGANPAAGSVLIEAALVLCATGGIGALALGQVHQPRRRIMVLVMLGLVAAGLNSVAAQGLRGLEAPLAWLTPGAQGGLITGCALLYLIDTLTPRARARVGLVCIVAMILLTNVAPVDRYFEDTLAAARGAQLVNLHGLLRWIAVAWPFAAIAWFWRRL